LYELSWNRKNWGIESQTSFFTLIVVVFRSGWWVLFSIQTFGATGYPRLDCEIAEVAGAAEAVGVVAKGIIVIARAVMRAKHRNVFLIVSLIRRFLIFS
jgi:hypothetical protein